jgi:predicted MFS family arabinose efflux permease
MHLILALCVAEVLTMAGVFAFPALLPTFVDEWSLTKTEAGWISGVYFGAYALTAPPLLALTDRLDARWVHFGGALLAAAAAAGFALFAEGFWTALLFRALGGAALAATYLPGLRVLMDRYRGPRPSRALSFYTSSFSLGTALSFLLAGESAALFGWRAAFAVTAAAALLAVIIPVSLAPARPEQPDVPSPLLDFRPVMANRRALAYVLGYGAHCWELFAMRSWLVGFLAFSLTLQPTAAVPACLAPTSVATVSGLVAMAASIGGNELCLRFGRRRVIALVMLASALCAAVFGFTAPLSYTSVVTLSLIYAAVIQLDSAALTAGAVEAALPGQRGATLAVHGLVGFGCAGIGPLAMGMVLDATGAGGTPASWGLAFASLALVGLLGPLAIRSAGLE